MAPTEPPIDLAVTRECGSTVTATMPITGGEISATGADGTLYTLTIPDDALELPTDISLTPVASITGLPTSGEITYAVQLEPSGLQLDDFAMLTITPTTPLPIDQQIPFGYEGDGAGMFLALPVVTDPRIQLRVLHFSGYGVTKGLLADMEPIRQRLGGTAETRLESQLAEGLQRLKGRDDAVSSAAMAALLEAFLSDYDAQVVQPRVAAAGNTCANGRLALQTKLQFMRMQQLLGVASGDFPSDLMTKVAHVCTQEEYEICRDQHVIHRMPQVVLGFERQRQLLGAEDGAELDFELGLAKKCLTFEVVLTSKANMTYGQIKVRSDVESTVKLTLDAQSLLTGTPHITGSSALKNTQFGYSVKGATHGCSLQNQRGGSTLNVTDLTWTADQGVEQQLGQVTDFALTFDPGTTTESAEVKCKRVPTQHIDGPWWSAAFQGMHADETNDKGTYTTVSWDVKQDELLGKKEWHKSGSGIKEDGSFELHHKPE